MPESRFTLPPQYDPHAVERPLYRRWLERGVFTARADSPKPPYVIVIPPPNVTAVLHMGQGLNNVTQDVLIRFERMRGREALWLPGTDHAGIATQNVVERLIAKEGKTRFDLGREAFVARVWAFVKETGPTILEQLKMIGASCDWTRTRFTFDPAYSRAVREVFVTLWEEGLIYRGHRVIHWCPRCLTALSDEEAESRDIEGKLYYLRYPVEGGPAPYVTVATTRPETLLGDTAVAVNPTDKRHRAFVGKIARLPIIDLPVPIIADDAVEPGFGTGFVKVTPAHDATDFEIGLRHKLEMPLVMTEDGRMEHPTRVPKTLADLDRFVAREKVVDLLKERGLLEKVEPHRHAVRHCYRCDSVVEPRLSDQWFVKMKPLAGPALEAYRSGAIRLVPERWGATYEHWMENIRDWNISRQLWWGHRIPVFNCTKCAHQWADREDPKACPKCGGPVEQDPDVLDTWFSSWLWPFATLGWPDRTPDLKRFYPGHTLVTAPEILFFWVARMIMAGYHFLGARPFSTVYLHGTVRDTQHRKMSKSLGNGIDPLDVVRLFGADALRWTAIAGLSVGSDLILDPDDLETTFAPGRNFANKLWNIGRFILAQLPEQVVPVESLKKEWLSTDDTWILTRAQKTIREVTSSLEQFKLDEAAKICFDFAWRDLADWYVEAVKPRLAGPMGNPAVLSFPQSALTAQSVLAYCFEVTLRLLHPVVPFITEELWQKLPGRKPEEMLIIADWPRPNQALESPEMAKQFSIVPEAVAKVRSIKAEYNIPSGAVVGPLFIRPSSNESRMILMASGTTIERLERETKVEFDTEEPDVDGSVHFVLQDSSRSTLPLTGLVNKEKECSRLQKEATRLDRQLASLTAKLSDQNFVSRAPAEVVAKEREKERGWREQRQALADK